MKKLFQGIMILILMLSIRTYGQQHPTYIAHSEPVQQVDALITKQLTPPEKKQEEINPRRNEGQNIIVPGKGLPTGNDPLLQERSHILSHPATNPILSFQATNYGVTPSDPTGAAGPNHYVVAYNTGFKIFDKTGNVLVNDTSLSSLFPGYVSDGDPIVLYDSFADRFLITEFDISSNPNKLLIAVSQTADPVNGGWYIYSFPMNSLPDYPKFSVWSDGYYITLNKNSASASSSEVVFVIERDKMLNGDTTAAIVGFPLPGISTSGFFSPLGFNAGGSTLPPVGDAPIIYLQDDSWANINQDHLKIWNINVDWNTTSNSTITNQPQILNTTAFNSVFNNGSFSNLPQPNGTDIDALQATIMYMANYRRFASYNSTVINFVVNTDNQGKAGIRWYELRQDNDGDPWYIYQEGTYIDPSNHNTFAGSINMDSQGNIGLGYTIVDSDQVPELRFTGRLKSDPLNQMTITSQAITPGVSSDPAYRYGDYAQLTIDPSDDKTFWFISEYFTSDRIVQVGTFKFASDFDNDVGITDITAPTDGVLSANESISVDITNFGLQNQSNIPVQYQINGGNVVTENYTGTIAPGATVNYTFSTTADMSNSGTDYTITASTSLASDQDNNNDAATVTVTHIYQNDMGITDILSPQSGTGLTNSENIQVVIKNFGGQSQSNVPVSFTLDGNTVSEVAPGPFAPGSEQNYTFTNTGDFSTLGNHQLSATTQLSNDQDSSNDSFSTQITNQICQPSSDCSYGDEISRLQFGSIDNSSSCDGTGYQDFTNISTAIQRGATHDMTITVGYGEEHVTAWIDYNDNFVFESSEIIINNQTVSTSGGAGTYTNTFSVNIPAGAQLGEHLMRIRTNWRNAVPDPCSDVDFGETEDYKVNVRDDAGIHNDLSDAMLSIKTLPDKHFIINLETTKITGDMLLQVFTIGGKEIVYHKLKNKNGRYTYDLNMQYVSKGVYLLRIGNNKGSKIKKIIVQ